MRTHKRKKNTRYRGSQTHRRGHRKRTRGLGNRGGVGMGGSENQKKSLIIKLYGMDYFGGDRALRRGRKPVKLKVIKLSDLIERFDSLIKQGIAKVSSKGFEFNLKGYKVLADEKFGSKISVKASAASNQAIEQIKSAGGIIDIIPTQKDKTEIKENKAEEKKNKKEKSETKKEQKK